MSKRIKKLHLSNFRGATTETSLEFDENKALTLIYGENGCGKSTLVDALDFVCNGKIGSLEDRSMTSNNKWDYLKSSTDKGNSLLVRMDYDGKTYSGKLGKKEASLCQTLNRPRAHILRKTQILKIIDAQPAKRYEEIQSLVEIPELNLGENSLREALKQVTKDLDEAVRASTQAEETLQSIWKAENVPEVNFLTWAKQLTAQDVASKRLEIQEIHNFLTPFRSTVDNLTLLAELKQTVQERASTKEDALAQLQKMEQAVAANGARLALLLKEADQYIGESEGSTCPVCESTVDTKILLTRIRTRLVDLQSISHLATNKENAEQEFANAFAILGNHQKKLEQVAATLYSVVADSKIAELITLKIPLTNFKKLEVQPVTPEESSDYSTFAQSLVSLLTPTIQKIETRQTNLNKAVQQHNAVQASLAVYQDKKLGAERHSSTKASLTAMLTIFENHRKKYVNKVLATISATAEELFQELHPGEDFGKAKFFLNPSKKGSLEYHGQFKKNAEIQPQAYYSDSHLDTLGICVFLAIGKCFNDGNIVVVLDDVISSVDHVHTDRFMDVIYKYAKDFRQVIMTTHYRPLKDRYLYAKGPGANVQIVELLPWSLDKGIAHTKTQVKVDKLESLMASAQLDRESTASHAGILLESILDFVTLQYRCKLPRKAQANYALGSLIQGLESKLTNALKVTKADEKLAPAVPLKDMIEKLASLTWIRNQVGCHFNIAGQSINDGDVRTFAQLTIELAKALICERCGELPRRNRSGSDWECSCSNKHLAPLTIPGERPAED